MLLLLDENLPKRLKGDLEPHEVYTVRDKGWNGMKNGVLLSLMLDHHFDALVTFDKNLRFQQNFLKYPLAVFVIHAPSNTYEVLKELTPQILFILEKQMLTAGPIVIGY
jgi:hypothetical protein